MTPESSMISITSPISYGAFAWAYMAINAIYIAIPLSKLVWVFVEEGEEEDGFFKMKTDQGKFNLEMEMYADIVKMAVIGLNMGCFLIIPTIGSELAVKGLPANPNEPLF